jgi:Ca2+-binding RTX toxin-like protein
LVSAVELAKVAATAGTLDDKKLIEKALNGADTFDLSIRNDVAFGFGGGDNMDGNGGGDTLMGGEGNDIVDGDTGNDRLFGENGRDTLKAGTGYDQLTGGNDRDQCFGGTDSLRDLFIFNNVSESRAKDPGSDGLANDVDRVFRFTLDEDDGVNDGDGDRIWLENIDSGDADGAFEFSGETAQAHSVWWERDGKDVYVFADVTGDTKADFAILLKGLDGTLTEEAFRL